MKKIIISIFIVAIALSGCSQPSPPPGNFNQGVAPGEVSDSRFQYLEPFSLNEVKTALILAGLQLSDNQQANPAGYPIYNINPGDYQINNVTPAIYSINYSNQILLVYIFKTIDERKEVLWFGESIGLPSMLTHLEGDYPGRAYAAGNVLIIDLLEAKPAPEITTADEKVLSILQNVVRSLNGSQEVVFDDKGTYWDARYVVDYYQHWYKDDKGTTHVDQYSNGKWTIKYIGTDPESIHNTWYEYEVPNSGGKGDGIFTKSGEDYYLKIGGDNNSNSIPDKDSVCTLTIQWDGQEESLNLKISNQSQAPAPVYPKNESG